MEAKGDLMLKTSELSMTIADTEKKKAEIEAQIESLSRRSKQSQAAAVEKAQSDFDERIARKKESVESAVSRKKESISSLIDSFTELGEKPALGELSIEQMEEKLSSVYPPELVEGYKCLNPIFYDSDEEAVYDYAEAESAVVNLQRGNLAGTVFNTLSALLDKAADYPQIGMKLAGGMMLFFLVGLVLSPFLFLTVFTVLGTLSAIQGKHVQGILRKIYSAKMYCTQEYDHDSFNAEKKTIMSSVIDYLDEAKDRALEAIDEERFQLDTNVISDIIKQYDNEAVQLHASLDAVNIKLGDLQSQLENQLKELELLEDKQKKMAETARGQYLSTIDWKKEWMPYVFLEVSSANKVKVFPFSQDNTLVYSKDSQKLKQFSRLSIYQSLIHMHPDFASCVVLDYKYNGGELTQFSKLPERCLKLCYSSDDCDDQIETITNRIRSRTDKILSTCASIEEFNELMKSYNARTEYYMVVHVFGMTSIPSKFLSDIRNGPKVGFFFKFYWTDQELQELKDNIPFDYLHDFYEITDNPIPRTGAAVRRTAGVAT